MGFPVHFLGYRGISSVQPLRGRPLLHSSVLTVSGPGLVFSRAAFLGTDAAMRIRVISWRRLHIKRGRSQHSHSPGLALLHKDGGDSPSSLLPHILYPFLLSMICSQIPESQNAGSGRNLEDHLVQLFSTGNHWVLPSPGGIWQCLETLLVVATRWGKWLLTSSGRKPGTWPERGNDPLQGPSGGPRSHLYTAERTAWLIIFLKICLFLSKEEANKQRGACFWDANKEDFFFLSLFFFFSSNFILSISVEDDVTFVRDIGDLVWFAC